MLIYNHCIFGQTVQPYKQAQQTWNFSYFIHNFNYIFYDKSCSPNLLSIHTEP